MEQLSRLLLENDCDSGGGEALRGACAGLRAAALPALDARAARALALGVRLAALHQQQQQQRKGDGASLGGGVKGKQHGAMVAGAVREALAVEGVAAGELEDPQVGKMTGVGGCGAVHWVLWGGEGRGANASQERGWPRAGVDSGETSQGVVQMLGQDSSILRVKRRVSHAALGPRMFTPRSSLSLLLSPSHSAACVSARRYPPWPRPPASAAALTPDELAAVGLLAGALRGMAEEGASAATRREAEPKAAAAAGKTAAVAAPRRYRPALPRSFVCPITHLLMRDPVTTEAGFSYERSAIEEWLRTHNVDPQYREYGDGTYIALARRAVFGALHHAAHDRAITATWQRNTWHDTRACLHACIWARYNIQLNIPLLYDVPFTVSILPTGSGLFRLCSWEAPGLYGVAHIHQANTVAALLCLLYTAGEPLASKSLKPNRALKGAIAEWLSDLDMSYDDFDSVSGVSHVR